MHSRIDTGDGVSVWVKKMAIWNTGTGTWTMVSLWKLATGISWLHEYWYECNLYRSPFCILTLYQYWSARISICKYFWNWKLWCGTGMSWSRTDPPIRIASYQYGLSCFDPLYIARYVLACIDPSIIWKLKYCTGVPVWPI